MTFRASFSAENHSSDHVVKCLLKFRLQEVVLENGTEAFAVWQNPPPPVYMQFYFFNLTNPQEVLSGDRPVVIELGPYTYR